MTQEGVQVVKVVDIDMEIRPLPKHSKNKEVVWLFDPKAVLHRSWQAAASGVDYLLKRYRQCPSGVKYSLC